MALYEAIFSGFRYSQLWQNKIHLETVDAGAITAEQIAIALDANWVDHIKFLQTGDTSYISIQVKALTAGSNEQFTRPLQKTGNQGPESQAASYIAGVIRKQTGLSGRAHRGRYYVQGIRQGATQFGQFQLNELNLWATQCNLLKQNWIAPTPHGLRLVIKHPEGATPVTGLQMRPILGVMRTRNIGVGI